MRLGPMRESDPALPIIRQYAERRSEQSRVHTWLAALFGKASYFHESGVRVDVADWMGVRYVTKVQYVGVMENIVPAPPPPDSPLPRLSSNARSLFDETIEVNLWSHPRHQLEIRHVGDDTVEYETAFLYCITCDKVVGGSVRKRANHEQTEEHKAEGKEG